MPGATNGVSGAINGTNQASSQAFAGVGGDFVSGIAGGVGGAIGSSIGAQPRMSGKQAGNEQRAFMEAAYPELNPWEMSGASSQAGTASQQTDNAENMQQQQMMGQLVQTAMSNETAVDVAKINAKSADNVAGVGSSASMRNVDEQLAQQLQEQEHRIELLKEQTRTERESKSALGRGYHDFKGIFGDPKKGVDSLQTKAKDSYEQGEKNRGGFSGTIRSKLEAMEASAKKIRDKIFDRKQSEGVKSSSGDPKPEMWDESLQGRKYLYNLNKK